MSSGDGVKMKTPGASSLFYGLTLFLSAGLLFAVQPLLGKQMLPLVGGSPSGWLTALAFFQMALLVGYLVAHGLSRLSARQQAWATAGVLAAGVLLLPPRLTADAGMNVGSVGAVLGLLFQGIFVPYVGLATVSSGLQRLYAARSGGKDPYFLYAASNAGSFAGLLAYPLIVEPLLPLSTQGVVWAAGYGLLIAMIGFLAWGKGTAEPTATAATNAGSGTNTGEETISWGRRGQWVLLAFIPSSLSMGLTALVTADLGSFPLLWVIPLGLYLLTFVIAFADKRKLQAKHLAVFQVVSAALILWLYGQENGYAVKNFWLALPVLLAFFVTALWCHLQLVDKRPSTLGLTEYYLWLSVGGALGGIFNAFIAPVVFNQPIEFMMTLFAATLLHPFPARGMRWVFGGMGVCCTLAAIGYMLTHDTIGAEKTIFVYALILLPIGVLLTLAAGRAVAVTGLLAVVLGASTLNIHKPLDVQRDFFGVIKIAQTKFEDGQVWRQFVHGSTVHGMQRIAPARDTSAVSYYAPLRDVIGVVQPKQVGIIGLGAGIMLCMTGPERQFTVYEIAPLVQTMAEKWFTYIEECGQPEWRIGDGRIELQQDKDKRYDMFIIDAFSSDSIPAHLLTKEALQLYLDRVADGGMIMMHVTNRYYNLRGPLATLTRDLGVQALTYVDSVTDLSVGHIASKWVLLARPGVDVSGMVAKGWTPLEDEGFALWTDDYANVMAALKLWSPDKVSTGEGTQHEQR
jgi:hypothetical protein